jgi:hypothetical protein
MTQDRVDYGTGQLVVTASKRQPDKASGKQALFKFGVLTHTPAQRPTGLLPCAGHSGGLAMLFSHGVLAVAI